MQLLKKINGNKSKQKLMYMILRQRLKSSISINGYNILIL